ncbi:MAG: fumarylacetoacetate hydrolase family protein [Gemmataceae bacterium]
MRRSRRVVEKLATDVLPPSQEEAYRIQAMLVERLAADAGGHTIGYKIAATNDMAQKQLNVTAPFCGRLLSHSTHPSGVTLPAAGFTHRIIEPEFGFLVGIDVPPSDVPYTKDTIAPFIAAVIPAIEVVDHRFADWTQVGAPSLIADNAIHGAWVEGEPHTDWRNVDLAAHATKLVVNGETVRNGSGAAVLGHPLNVVAWLANVRPLRAGDKITTGTTTAVYFATPGDRITADFGAFGRAEVNFT